MVREICLDSLYLAIDNPFASFCQPSLTIAATSNDPWGPTGTEMAEISSLTFGRYALHP